MCSRKERYVIPPEVSCVLRVISDNATNELVIGFIGKISFIDKVKYLLGRKILLFYSKNIYIYYTYTIIIKSRLIF